MQLAAVEARPGVIIARHPCDCWGSAEAGGTRALLNLWPPACGRATRAARWEQAAKAVFCILALRRVARN